MPGVLEQQGAETSWEAKCSVTRKLNLLSPFWQEVKYALPFLTDDIHRELQGGRLKKVTSVFP